MEDRTIDINDKQWYEYNKPELEDRTRARLQEIKDLGLIETGIASFGIPGQMSGLYIERVWSYSEEDWKGYVDWVKEVKERYEQTN